MNMLPYTVTGKIDLSDFRPSDTAGCASKEEGEKMLERYRDALSVLQDKMFAQASFSILLILQAMDTAGKDGAIKHIFAGVNPQGIQ